MLCGFFCAFFYLCVFLCTKNAAVQVFYCAVNHCPHARIARIKSTHGFFVFTYVRTYTMLYSSVLYSPVIVHPPASTVVYPNAQAVFTCELASESTVAWLVNGQDSRILPEDDISTGSNELIETLNITARRYYNNAKVQCLALEIGGSTFEKSPIVTLTIQGTSI